MRKVPTHLQLLPKDKRWLRLFVMAEALGPPPSVKAHRPTFDQRNRAGRHDEDPKL